MKNLNMKKTSQYIAEPEQQSPTSEKSQPDFEETSQDVPESQQSDASQQPETLRYK